MKTREIQTVLAKIKASDLGKTLPHEHLFTDLRGPRVSNYAQGDPDHIVSVLKPYVQAVNELGVEAMVECSTIGVGRNPFILEALALGFDIHIIAPTGVYREAYVPPNLLDKSKEELAELWTNDIMEGIEGTNVKAGFIKMAVSDNGITDIERKNLEAAVMASQRTGAVIASHTIGGDLVISEIEILLDNNLNLNRFIWTHAQSEIDTSYQLKAAEYGAYISIDAIGSGWTPDEDMLNLTLKLIRAGFADQILLSHDAGWYDPSQPNGHPKEGGIRGYTALFTSFIPALIAKGIHEETITQITIDNPARAFSLKDSEN